MVLLLFCLAHQKHCQAVISDDDEESSSEEEEEIEKLANKAPDEKSTRETEAGEELSALVNYVQPVHFTSFENAASEHIIFTLVTWTFYLNYLRPKFLG